MSIACWVVYLARPRRNLWSKWKRDKGALMRTLFFWIYMPHLRVWQGLHWPNKGAFDATKSKGA